MDVSAQNKWKKKSLEKQPQMTALTFRVFLFLPSSFQGNVSKACTFTLFEKATSLLLHSWNVTVGLWKAFHTLPCVFSGYPRTSFINGCYWSVSELLLYFSRGTPYLLHEQHVWIIFIQWVALTHTNFIQFINEVLAATRATQVNRDDVFKDFIF